MEQNTEACKSQHETCSEMMQETDTNISESEINALTLKWMPYCIKLAKQGLELGEVPVGCVFLYNGEKVAEGYNMANATKNATSHAELICVNQVVKKYKNNWSDIFSKIIVVVTIEPCIMCAGLLHDINIKAIMYGCDNDRFGGCGSVKDVAEVYNSKCIIRKGFYKTEAMDLLKTFYRGTNPNAPPCKVRKK